MSPPDDLPSNREIAPEPTLTRQPAPAPEPETLPPRPPPELAESAARTGAGRAQPTDGEPATGRVSIAGYELLSELGRGGMGVVYKARQVGLNRLVALKMILHGGHAGSSDLARFRTEAEAVARLQHAHIVQIHEIGAHAGLPYFSLEFCAGGSLAQKLAGTPLPPQEAAALVEQLARAMAAAHAAGIIHRDLKPANVLLQSSFTAESAENAEKRSEKKSIENVSALSAFSAVSFIPRRRRTA